MTSHVLTASDFVWRLSNGLRSLTQEPPVRGVVNEGPVHEGRWLFSML